MLDEAFYGVPGSLKKECVSRLPEEFLEILKQFEHSVSGNWHKKLSLII